MCEYLCICVQTILADDDGISYTNTVEKINYYTMYNNIRFLLQVYLLFLYNVIIIIYNYAINVYIDSNWMNRVRVTRVYNKILINTYIFIHLYS